MTAFKPPLEQPGPQRKCRQREGFWGTSYANYNNIGLCDEPADLMGESSGSWEEGLATHYQTRGAPLTTNIGSFSFFLLFRFRCPY